MPLRNVLLFAAPLALVLGIYALRMGLSWESDFRTRPWAYSRDPQAKLLVGQWTGEFQDPSGVAKTLELKIDEPLSRDEREKRALHRHKRSVGALRQDKQSFDGVAAITSRLGREEYRVSGFVDEEDFHRLNLRFLTDDQARLIHLNDTAFEAVNGRWKGDEMMLTVRFQRHNADGSLSSSSTGTVVDGQLVWVEDTPIPEVKVHLHRTESPGGRTSR